MAGFTKIELGTIDWSSDDVVAKIGLTTTFSSKQVDFHKTAGLHMLYCVLDP